MFTSSTRRTTNGRPVRRATGLLVAPLAALAVATTAAAAGSTTITFDGLDAHVGQAAVDEINASLTGTGVSFFAGSVTAAFPQTIDDRVVAATFPSADDVRIDFARNVESVSAYVSGGPGSTSFARATRSAGDEVDLVTGSSTATLQVSGPCIRSVVFENSGAAFVFDDVVFHEMDDDSPCDDDADGVINADDLCADTAVGTDDVAPRLKGHRFGSNAAGEFVSGDGSDSGFDLSDTGGCSASQIIDAADLGQGHARFGISASALAAWVASV